MCIDFTELFRYTHHSNQKLIEKIYECDVLLTESTEKLINHILNAHHIWNSRIINSISYDVWQVHESRKLLQIDVENFTTSLLILDNYNLEDSISYRNSKGETYSNSIKDILYHVINHSTYHRAQIATNFKNQGLEPISTDFIFYKRLKE